MPRGYIPNPGFVRQLESSPWIAQQMLEKANLAKEVAQGIAESEAIEGGYYARDIHADRVGKERGKVAAFLDARNFKAHWIEWGSVHNQARHVLQRAVEIALGISPRGD